MSDPDKIQDFVQNIKTHQEFKKLNYFLRSMKKMIHGGVARIGIPNCFMKHYSPFEALRMYFPRLGGEIRYSYIFSDCVEITKNMMGEYDISIEDLLSYICWSREPIHIWWYLSCCLAFPKDCSSENMMLDTYTVIDQKSIKGTRCSIKRNETIIVFLCILSYFTPIDNLTDITKIESLQSNCDKYGLSDITTARFNNNGYIIDNLFYPYNVFFDISVGSPMSQQPLLIELMQSIDTVSIWMRRDNAIALEASKAYTVATADAQVFRGTTLDFKKMDIRRKNEIVRYDPNTMNKLYLSAIPMESGKPNVLSLAIEELWAPDLADDDSIMTTNFIHATYNLDTECIEHMDHSINEYSDLQKYRDKHNDTSAKTGTPIDAYADNHYKIWCVKSPRMNLDDWYKLAYASLDEPFRPLFDEMFDEKDN